MTIDYDQIPVEHMRGGVKRYIEDGIKPGGFLTAVICNDLSGAYGRADEENSKHMASWVRWFHWEAPASCWGAPEKMREWLANGYREYAEVVSR